MAKISLDFEYNFDFTLFAIVCQESDYKVCHEINRILNINLEKDFPLELKQKKATDQLLFSQFSFTEEESFTEYILLSNLSYNAVPTTSATTTAQLGLFGEDQGEMVSRAGYLIPELENYQFLFVVRSENPNETAEQLKLKLQSINSFLAIKQVDPNGLASKKNLII